MMHMIYDTHMRTRYPIHGEPSSHSGNTERYSIIRATNERILKEYVYQALADHDMLSGRLVTQYPCEPAPEKTFTVQIYREDIGGRFGNRVMFANSHDVDRLLAILVKEVGEERMGTIKEKINDNSPNDIHKAGMKWRKKWKEGEDWPL